MKLSLPVGFFLIPLGSHGQVITSRANSLISADNSLFGALIEGGGVDADGNLYATNFAGETVAADRSGFDFTAAIGKITIDGGQSLFFENEGSLYNGIRFDRTGKTAFLADILINAQVTLRDGSIQGMCGDPSILQPNDVAVNRRGDVSFLTGQDFGAGLGDLWRCEGGVATLVLGGIGRTNGVDFSPDDGALYYTEAPAGGNARVMRFTLDEDGKTVGPPVVFREFVPFQDLDGIRTDTLGNLYVTIATEPRVVVLSPTGELLEEIELAGVSNPTNLDFGGPEGRTLFVVGRCGGGFGSGPGCVDVLSRDVVGRTFSAFSCCSLNFKDCVDWCPRDEAGCSACNSDYQIMEWLEGGSRASSSCLPRWDECTTNTDGCCDGLECIGDNLFRQCSAPGERPGSEVDSESCCSNNYKDCVGWCPSDEEGCNACNGGNMVWLEFGSRSDSECLPRWGACTSNTEGCCDGLECVGNEHYRQCVVPEQEDI